MPNDGVRGGDERRLSPTEAVQRAAAMLIVSSGNIAMITEGSCSNVEGRLKNVHKECDDTLNGWSLLQYVTYGRRHTGESGNPTPRGRASSNGRHEVDREGGIGGGNAEEKDDSDLSRNGP